MGCSRLTVQTNCALARQLPRQQRRQQRLAGTNNNTANDNTRGTMTTRTNATVNTQRNTKRNTETTNRTTETSKTAKHRSCTANWLRNLHPPHYNTNTLLQPPGRLQQRENSVMCLMHKPQTNLPTRSRCYRRRRYPRSCCRGCQLLPY